MSPDYIIIELLFWLLSVSVTGASGARVEYCLHVPRLHRHPRQCRPSAAGVQEAALSSWEALWYVLTGNYCRMQFFCSDNFFLVKEKFTYNTKIDPSFSKIAISNVTTHVWVNSQHAACRVSKSDWPSITLFCRDDYRSVHRQVQVQRSERQESRVGVVDCPRQLRPSESHRLLRDRVEICRWSISAIIYYRWRHSYVACAVYNYFVVVLSQ